MNERVTVAYTSSQKKRNANAGVFFFVVLFLTGMLGWGRLSFALYMFIVAVFFCIWIFAAWKATKDAFCPSCKAEIFDIIEAAKRTKVPINYCPQCGSQIET